LAGLRAWAEHNPALVEVVPQSTLHGSGDELAHLRRLLEQDDSAAVEYLQHNAATLGPVLGAAFEAVQGHVASYDFEQALEALAVAEGSPAQGDDGAPR